MTERFIKLPFGLRLKFWRKASWLVTGLDGSTIASCYDGAKPDVRPFFWMKLGRLRIEWDA